VGWGRGGGREYSCDGAADPGRPEVSLLSNWKGKASLGGGVTKLFPRRKPLPWILKFLSGRGETEGFHWALKHAAEVNELVPSPRGKGETAC